MHGIRLIKGWLLTVLVGASVGAAAQSNDIDFSSTGIGNSNAAVTTDTVSGDLGNGVHWALSGSRQWYTSGVDGYPGYDMLAIRPQSGPITWTFDQPVSVEFDVIGLNCEGESLALPSAAQTISLATTHSRDSLRVVHIGPGVNADGGDVSTFRLDAVTSLELATADDGGSVAHTTDCARGISRLSISPIGSGGAATAVPANTGWGIALLICACAVIARRKLRGLTT